MRALYVIQGYAVATVVSCCLWLAWNNSIGIPPLTAVGIVFLSMLVGVAIAVALIKS